MELRNAWDRESQRWIAWSRAPGHDSYWRFHRRRLLGLLPPPGTLTLDVGCGEGRVARDLAELGHRVVGFDPSPGMVSAAATHENPSLVIQADGARLPVADGVADLVLAFMSVHDMDEPNVFIEEAARVLVAGGRLYVAIVSSVEFRWPVRGPYR